MVFAYYSSLDLLSAARSEAKSASTLDLLRAYCLTPLSAPNSASTRDLLKASTVAALEAASSASSLDLLSAFSASRDERYLDLEVTIRVVGVHRKNNILLCGLRFIY